MSKSTKARVFVPLMKVDEEQRLVYGRATAQEIDQSGEMMDYETSKPLFKDWSDQIESATNGLSKGNLRVMHSLQVAGKLTDIAFDDEEKVIDVCAKVVDDAQWAMVMEGCYTGFSIGGSYAKRWTEEVDGEKVKKFTAKPNEISLVDNPCVKSATFSLIKAAGGEEQVAFKKVDEAVVEETKAEETVKTEDTPAPAAEPIAAPTNEQVVEEATKIAKAANDGTTWMDHVVAARDNLIKGTALGLAVEQAAEERENEQGQAKKEDVGADEGAQEEKTNDAPAPAQKVTPAGVKQVWTASDGSAFEKKSDAEKHEAALAKAKVEPTEAEKLMARLSKASETPTEEQEAVLLEDFERLGKVFDALSTPFGEDGQPKLEKGMYTINRFSSVLSDMASLSRSIKNEANREGGDEDDKAVSEELIACVKTLGTSFLSYAKNQIEELLAGIDDEVCVSYHDYYYASAKADPDNQLAKDVVSAIDEFREPSRETREKLSKLYGVDPVQEISDELSPPMQKRFDELTRENKDIKEVAEKAVGQVEELTKRMATLEDTAKPRAPKGNALTKGHDLGITGEDGKVIPAGELSTHLMKMLEGKTPEEISLMLIKGAHAQGGQKLTLHR